MKLKWIVLPIGLGVLAALIVSLSAAHGDNGSSATPFLALSAVAVPELPAKAADLVHAAASADREQVAEEVLRAVGAIAKPGVLPYVVSAICGTAPDIAGTAVATATSLHPEDVLFFTRAALCAAPNQVEPVVFSACATAPSLFQGVVVMTARQFPGAYDTIRAGLVRARPDLELYLEEAETRVGATDVEVLMQQTSQLITADSKTRPQ
jgi:hypothetical protein